ncbi:MAG: DUF6152 family protein [Vicinamibacterales bacterium]
MSRIVVAAVVAVVVASIGGPVTAHHSFAAQYDRDKTITLNGTVTRVEWMNPHVYFYLDVKDASGAVSHWAIEGGAPTSLYRAGWRKDALKVGDVVTVHGYLARDGSKLANMRAAVLPDGREVLGGQNYYGPGAPKPPGQ